MIVTCENCFRQFNLNELLLKPNGSKVRCTKCSNIFIAYPQSRDIPNDEIDTKGYDLLDALAEIYVLVSNDERTASLEDNKKQAPSDNAVDRGRLHN